MSSVFISEHNDQSQPPEPTRPKRPRSSYACSRCKKKKVKCDFAQPTCKRCAASNSECEYATPPRRVDKSAFKALGIHVESLRNRMQKLQDELDIMRQAINTTPGNENQPPSSVTATVAASSTTPSPVPVPVSDTTTTNCTTASLPFATANKMKPACVVMENAAAAVAAAAASPFPNQSPAPAASAQQHRYPPDSTWRMELPPTIQHTDVNDMAAMCQALLDGISHLNINNESAITDQQHHMTNNNNHAQHNIMGDAAIDALTRNCYHCCFLPYQSVETKNGNAPSPLLTYSIRAWVAQHACIFHQACHGVDPTLVGEPYYKGAQQLLMDQGSKDSAPTLTTIHALLNLYMYQISNGRSDLAHSHIGMAVRMAQELGLHRRPTRRKRSTKEDIKQAEKRKRLWWSVYWLDLWAALGSNRPAMVDDLECNVDPPMRLDNENDEIGYRIGYGVHSIRLLRIRKDIINQLSLHQANDALLSAITKLEQTLRQWSADLPLELRFPMSGTLEGKGAFKDEACLLLTIQHHTTWIMLHKFFLPRHQLVKMAQQQHDDHPNSLLSLNICTRAAIAITRALEMYASNGSWCQFYYVLDGVLVSIAVHQLNALSNDAGIACLAQRNLIATANILGNSPMIYMQNVRQVIENIQTFLRKEGMPTRLEDVPPVDGNAVLRQSTGSSRYRQQPSSEGAVNSVNADATVSSMVSGSSPSGTTPSPTTVHNTMHQTTPHAPRPSSYDMYISPEHDGMTTTQQSSSSSNVGMVSAATMATTSNMMAPGVFFHDDPLMEFHLSGRDGNMLFMGGNEIQPTHTMNTSSEAALAQHMFGSATVDTQQFTTVNEESHHIYTTRPFPASESAAAAAAAVMYQQQQPRPPPQQHQQPSKIAPTPNNVYPHHHQHHQQQHPMYTQHTFPSPMRSTQQQRQQQRPMASGAAHYNIMPTAYDPAMFASVDPSVNPALLSQTNHPQQYNAHSTFPPNNGTDDDNEATASTNGYSTAGYARMATKRSRGDWDNGG
ncbi:hypothetical protein K492DRAFT_203337 [Lichtheimia hyalospora FSU 10163]|nr:hypothetical protein K492DRAFT_203337 [Lichtheimia hyalospora FSU 10163]